MAARPEGPFARTRLLDYFIGAAVAALVTKGIDLLGTHVAFLGRIPGYGLGSIGTGVFLAVVGILFLRRAARVQAESADAAAVWSPLSEEEVRFDRDHLYNLVMIIADRVDATHLTDEPGPYVELYFSIFNGSIFPLTFERPIYGQVRCLDKELQQIPQASFDKLEYKHAWRGQLTFRQNLSLAEAAWIRGEREAGTPIQFWLGDVEVWATPEGGVRQKVELNRGQGVAIG
jgi:hypothetical protein